MTIEEMRLAGEFLKLASDEFGSHGCNDLDIAIFDRAGLTQEHRDKLNAKMQLWNGEEDHNCALEQWPDSCVMRYLSEMLINAARGSEESPR